METYERRNHGLAKIVLMSIIGISVLLIGLFTYLYIQEQNRQPLIKYPLYELSTRDWTSGNVTITITNDQSKISAYSFDGGKNFQDSPSYEVLANEVFMLTVKDRNGRLSKTISVPIKNIDKEAPQINFENPTTVQMNSNFSVRNGVVITEEGSGLSNNYVATPDNIDTTHEGTYEVTYTAFDKVGNYTEKKRTIIVKDIVGRTYYRTRTISTENYQCEPYACNCVVTDTAKVNKTCPSGFTFNEPDKCCQTCYKTCKKTNYGEWSNWSQTKAMPSSTLEVETKVE